MAAKVKLSIFYKKQRRKRPEFHSKNRNTNQKTGKYYDGSKYRGQGRAN